MKPFDRLKFYTVHHPLRDRLTPYQASEVPILFREASWSTLRYWSMLLEEFDAEEIEERVLTV